MEEFIKRHVGSALVKSSVITCVATVNKNSPESNVIACPVIGTEAGHVYVLDPQAFSIIHQVSSICTYPENRIWDKHIKSTLLVI